MFKKIILLRNSVIFVCIFSWPCYAVTSEGASSLPEKRSFLIRGMFLNIKPVNVKSDISAIGGNIDTPDKRVPGIDISYYMSSELSVNFQGGVFSRDYAVRDSKIGSFRVGNIESNSISFTAQYHLNMCCNLSPYFGTGINRAWARKVKPAQGIPMFEVKDVTSLILATGMDYALSERWQVSLSVNYILSPAYHFQGDGFSANVKMDTLVTGIGIGYKF